MALLTPNDTLLPAYIHPDRVAFQFGYASPPNTTAYAARILLKQLVTDGRDMPGMALSFTIPVEGLASRVRVKFTKPNAARPFFFKVYLSPLTLLRQPLVLDRAKDGQMNFLTAAQTSLDNSFVAVAVGDLLIPIEAALHELSNRLAAAISPGGFSSLLECRLHTLELCADIECNDPGRFVERAYSTIRANFKNTIEAAYRSAAAYRGVEGDALMAWGFAQRGERIKVYEKGTRRVRLECALEKCALEKVLSELGSSRKLDDPDDFVRACRLLALHTAERFAHFSNIHVRTSTDPSPAQLIALASKGYLADFAEQSLLTLARTGRIRRSASPPLVKAWEKRGIVRSTCHGFYTVTDLFRSALEAFRQLADAWAAGTDRSENNSTS
jgi:hypothetical protein